MQCVRLDHALDFWQRGNESAGTRFQFAVETELNLAFRADIGTRPFERRPVYVPTFELQMQVANELDLLAVRNLMRAQDRLPKKDRPTLIGQRELLLLRNVTEHPGGGGSARELADRFPQFEAGLLSSNRRQVWIGGKDAGVPLSDIWTWMEQIQAAIVRMLEAAGETVPRLDESMIEGDEGRSWPAERVAYSWDLPIQAVEQWPRLVVSEGRCGERPPRGVTPKSVGSGVPRGLLGAREGDVAGYTRTKQIRCNRVVERLGWGPAFPSLVLDRRVPADVLLKRSDQRSHQR